MSTAGVSNKCVFILFIVWTAINLLIFGSLLLVPSPLRDETLSWICPSSGVSYWYDRLKMYQMLEAHQEVNDDRLRYLVETLTRDEATTYRDALKHALELENGDLNLEATACRRMKYVMPRVFDGLEYLVNVTLNVF